MPQQTYGAPAWYRRLEDENARLRAALIEFGEHTDYCKAKRYANEMEVLHASDPRCDCGLRGALNG